MRPTAVMVGCAALAAASVQHSNTLTETKTESTTITITSCGSVAGSTCSRSTVYTPVTAASSPAATIPVVIASTSSHSGETKGSLFGNSLSVAHTVPSNGTVQAP